MRIARALFGCVAAALALGASTARAELEAPRLGVMGEARWAQLPQDRTWVAGIAAEARAERGTVILTGDVARLRDPRADADDIGLLLMTIAVGRRIAGTTTAWLEAQAVGSVFVAVVGDVGVGAPGVGPGLRGVWRLSRALSLEASAQMTAPIPISDAHAALRFTTGALALSVGWRDVRALPLFGLPLRYASAPQVSAALAF